LLAADRRAGSCRHYLQVRRNRAGGPALLIAARANENPGRSSGVFVFSQRGSSRDAGLLEAGHFRAEVVKPLDDLRVTPTPLAFKAKIAIAERAGERDRADIRNGLELRR